MWLTGFDAPCMHTLYVDKPMKGHNLMQAIARVNRVFKDKQGGLVVDYIGIANELRSALKEYTASNVIPKPLDEAVTKIWGFASENARHINEGREPAFEEAELVVSMVAGISSYLAKKHEA